MSDKIIGTLVPLIVSFLVISVLSYPAMLLWNSVAVQAFSVASPVSWGQMFGLLYLLLILNRSSS